MRFEICLMLCVLSTPGFGAAITYSAENLGTFNFLPRALNNRGWIVGHHEGEQPYRFRPGIGSEALSTAAGLVTDINDNGTAVGARFKPASFVYNAAIRPSGAPWTPLHAGPLNSVAAAVNESGHVVGMIGDYAFLYTPEEGVTYFLGTEQRASASEINESGQILGTLENGNTYLWDAVNGIRDLSAVILSSTFEPVALSDGGIVVGNYFHAATSRFAVYSDAIGYRRPGTLGGSSAFARDTNDRGWVVGTSTTHDETSHAFLYVYGRGVMDLNSLAPDLDVTLIGAYAINDRDQILALGEDSNYYLLSRVTDSMAAAIATPEPAAFWLIATGLAAIALWRRR